RRVLRRSAQARRYASTGEGRDEGLEPACVSAACRYSARGRGGAVAGRVGGKYANIADRVALRVGGRVADRVREPGEFADVALGGASPRNGGAGGARREAREVDHAVSGREPHACGIR